MIVNWSTTKIFIKPGATDMRKQINGLAVLVEEELAQNPLSGHLFLFCNSIRTHVKILYWDKNGFCLWLKRLEQDRFPWPKTGREARELSFEQLQQLLDGIDFFHAHKTLHFQKIQ